MNLATLLQTQSQTRPQAPAIIEVSARRERTTSFADLESRVGQAVTLLQRYNLQPGDAVLVFYPMSSELYVILGALFRLGLVGMFLDPSADRQYFAHCCALCPPRAMIASTKAYWLTLRSLALQQIPLKFAVGLPLPGTIPWYYATLAANPSIVATQADTPALLSFTSGSTGHPKPVLRTHGFFGHQYRVLVESLHLTAGITELTTLPLFVLANLASGATTLIPQGNLRAPGAIAPAPIIRQLQIHQPDRLLASPAFLERLVEDCRRKKLIFAGVQRIISGGAPITPRLLHQLEAFAPNAEIVVLYGSTEAEPIAQITYAQMQPGDRQAMTAGHGLLVGQPIPVIQLKILRDQWGAALPPYRQNEFLADCLPSNQVGEIVVSGDHVLKHYWQDLGNQETKFQVDGQVWHRTGDAGYLDEGGRLWLMGRCGAVIRDKKGCLYPFAVECLMQQHPSIHRSTVVSHRGQRLLLIEPIPSKARLTLNELQPLLKAARIDAVRVLPKIPMDDRHNSKIAYSKLKSRLSVGCGVWRVGKISWRC